MKKIVLFLSLSIFSFASLLDFLHLKNAKEAYENKQYEKAVKNYNKVDNDSARFNKADALYRNKNYEKAIQEYKSIKNKDLEFKKLHNIGNSYAKLHKLDKAIESYEKALKLQNDEDTKYNLELVKKEKKRNKQDKKNKKDKKDERDGKSKKENKDKKDKSKKKQENKKDNRDKKNKEKKKNEEKKDKKSLDKKKEEEKKKQEKRKKQEQKAMKKTKAISDMEERKWQKQLNQRGIHTLMLPLNKGETNDDTKPW